MTPFDTLLALIFGGAAVFLICGLLLGTRGLLGDMGRICLTVGGALCLLGLMLAVAQARMH